MWTGLLYEQYYRHWFWNFYWRHTEGVYDYLDGTCGFRHDIELVWKKDFK